MSTPTSPLSFQQVLPIEEKVEPLPPMPTNSLPEVKEAEEIVELPKEQRNFNIKPLNSGFVPDRSEAKVIIFTVVVSIITFGILLFLFLTNPGRQILGF